MFTYHAAGIVWSTSFSPDGKWWAVSYGNAYYPQHSYVALFRGGVVASGLTAESVANTAPSIAAQPVSQTVADTKAGAVTFGVFAVGAPPLSYQWFRDARELPGQTNSTLTIANATAADAGDYSVVVKNRLGSVASSKATLSIGHVREVPIAEVDFHDKQPSAGYSAYAYSENRVAMDTSITEMAGAGADGKTGLVMTADGSGFKANMDQNYAGFGARVAVLAGRADGVDTTDLNQYKLYATVRTTGQKGKESHGRFQWQFLTPTGTVLTISRAVTLTSNYEVYSYVLGDGAIDRYAGGSRSEFIANFDRINELQCVVNADNWLDEYGPGADSKIYVSDVKFVRLVPDSPSPPR
jgi:hypothetical protein